MTRQRLQDASPALVSPEWLAAHRGDPDLRVIEVAGLGQEQLQAWQAGHVPGALGFEWKSLLWDSHAREFPDPAEFARRMGAAGVSPDTTVVVYGEPVQFGVYAWWVLRYCGHARVSLLDGGRHAWQAAGLPLSTATPDPPAPVDYPPVARVESMRTGRDAVLAALGRPGVVLLDGRSGEEYRGERVGAPGHPDTGALRYGRIPGARHLMFESLLDADRRFLPPEAIRSRIEQAGITDASEVITYCRMSHRATVLYFALTELAGCRDVKVYDGSWTEWGNLVGMPIER